MCLCKESRGHQGQPLLDPCSPLPSRYALQKSSPKHVCSCQLPGVCVNVYGVCTRIQYMCLDKEHFYIFQLGILSGVRTSGGHFDGLYSR